jgi:replicative DNA helicase
MKSFTITLEDINSAFGISAETLTAIANSYGVPEEQIIMRALTQWAKAEIPDLDLDAPHLSQEQFNTLLERRRKLGDSKDANSLSLHDMFTQMARAQGASDDIDPMLKPPHGGNP